MNERAQYDQTRRNAAQRGFRRVSGGHRKTSKKKAIGSSQAHEVRRLEPVGCPVLGTDRHIYRMPIATHIPRKSGTSPDKLPLPSWWTENVSDHAYRCNRAFAIAMRNDRTDYENWWFHHMPSELAHARAEFILRDRRVAWFCTFTIGNANREKKRPHPEELRKAVAWFMRKQVHYANFAYDFSPQNAIHYSIHFERGECACGENRWHAHVLIFDNPRVTHGFLAKWSAWWENLYGWCKIAPPDDVKKVVRYCAGYAAKHGDFDIRDTAQDNREFEERKIAAEGPRATPCRKCGKISLCICPHPDQFALFSEASSRVPPYRSTRAREDAFLLESNMHGDAARDGTAQFAGRPRAARSAGMYSARRRERFLRYRSRWREERRRHHEQVSPQS